MNMQDMKARISALEAKVKALENPIFPKAATGCGVLAYYKDEAAVPHILFSSRGASHGGGTGITGGGFFNIAKAKPYTTGQSVLTHEEECYRELCEEFRDAGQDENPADTLVQVMAKASAFVAICSYQRFTKYAEPLMSFVIQTPNDPFNDYHDCHYFALEMFEPEATALMALSGNDERPDTVAVSVLDQVALSDIVARLFHEHEREPILKLVKRLSAEYLMRNAG